MRKTFVELMRYLLVPNTLLLGFRNVRDDYISRPIPHCRTLHKQDASGFLVIRFRRRCRKSEWRLRYCVIYNNELFLYRSQAGRSEDIETCRISLLRALEFTITANMVRETGLPPLKNAPRPHIPPAAKTKSMEPICLVKIVDEKQRMYELGVMDPKSALYWTNTFYAAFFRSSDSFTNQCGRQPKPKKPKNEYRSYFLRTTVEETRTFVVRSTLVTERDMDDEVARKPLRERHYTATSNVAVDDTLLSTSVNSPASRDLKSLTPSSTKSKFLAKKAGAKTPTKKR